jgi:tetratricopeptide (TPR) repeat protein
MRLITIPIVILILFVIFSIFTPVLLLQASEPILPTEMRQTFAQVCADGSSILGRYETCVEVYDYLISKYPEIGHYFEKKSEYLQKLGKLQESVTALDGAIGREPENIEYLLKKARITKSLNKIQESDATYSRIDQIKPKTASGFDYSGDAALDRGMYQQAYNQYTQSLALDSTNAQVWEKRGDVIFALLTIPTAGLNADDELKTQDLYTEGIKSYENAIRLNPGKAVEIQFKLTKRSIDVVPKTIGDLESRYTQYKYLDKN